MWKRRAGAEEGSSPNRRHLNGCPGDRRSFAAQDTAPHANLPRSADANVNATEDGCTPRYPELRVVVAGENIRRGHVPGSADEKCTRGVQRVSSECGGVHGKERRPCAASGAGAHPQLRPRCSAGQHAECGFGFEAFPPRPEHIVRGDSLVALAHVDTDERFCDGSRNPLTASYVATNRYAPVQPLW